MAKNDLSAQRLRELLHYNPDTGEFLWRPSVGYRAKFSNKPAGHVRSADGYRTICVDGIHNGAHRIAWIMFYGVSPDGVVDHINGNTSDNSIENLRCVNHRLNCQNRTQLNANNTSGFRGVVQNARKTRWRARARLADGSRVHVGYYKSAEAAAEALSIWNSANATS